MNHFSLLDNMVCYCECAEKVMSGQSVACVMQLIPKGKQNNNYIERSAQIHLTESSATDLTQFITADCNNN